MRILVCNDDGYASEGIIVLARAMRALGDVTIVAPESDRSGFSHKVSFHDPVRVRKVENTEVPTFACSGTPADCVILGAFEYAGGMPDLVVAGINRGANVGDDISYSGTVACAVEATQIGIPAIAVSLTLYPSAVEELHWQGAADVALGLARVWRERLGPATLLNVNVPNLPAAEIGGVRWTQQGRKRYTDRLLRDADVEGDAVYAISGSFNFVDVGKGTDLEAIGDGFCSITPVTIDRTDRGFLAQRNPGEGMPVVV